MFSYAPYAKENRELMQRDDTGVIFQVIEPDVGRWMLVMQCAQLGTKVSPYDASVEVLRFLGQIVKVMTTTDNLGRTVQIPVVKVTAMTLNLPEWSPPYYVVRPDEAPKK